MGEFPNETNGAKWITLKVPHIENTRNGDSLAWEAFAHFA